MMKPLLDWFDSRTGVRQLTHEALFENIPGGSRWIYVTGSMLVFAFVTQAITGIFLWMSYSPGSQNAWESVYYIQNEMQGGWLLRGVHHYMAQGMVVLLPLHLLQVILCRAYVAPREINYWLGLVLMLITLGLGLTGYLLPWDQKGYWATKVATELMSLPPGGGYLQKLVVGGSEYGHLTLTRFFALHTGVLPALLVAVLGLHVAMFRKHGITAHSSPQRADEYFWPKQVYKDAVACLVLLGLVLFFVFRHGAELGAPAEPTESYGAARPEWYFLFLFQLLKKFKSEFVGAIVVPSAAMGFLFMLPLIAKIKFGHIVNVVVMLILVIGAGYLTYEAIDHDNYAAWHGKDTPADEQAKKLHEERKAASEDYHAAKADGEREYERVRELVEHFGIPREGAATGLQRNDPETMGPRIFRRSCASCHSAVASDGRGIPGPKPAPTADGQASSPNGAPNLYGFASRDWLQRLLSNDEKTGIASGDFFGNTIHGAKQDGGGFKSGGMVEFVHDNLAPAKLSAEEKQSLSDLIVALSAEANLVSQRELDKQATDDGTIQRGRDALTKKFGCTDCHKFHDEGELGTAPDLTGYGSADWLQGMMANPTHERFYKEGNDRMPAFAPNATEPSKNQLTPHDLQMLTRWLRGDNKNLADMKVAD